MNDFNIAFYDLSKEKRNSLVETINQDIANDLLLNETENIITYYSDEDTYIRKVEKLSPKNLI